MRQSAPGGGLAGVFVVALIAGLAAGATAASVQVSGQLLETIVVPFGQPKGKVYTSTVTLQKDTTYTLVASGVGTIKSDFAGSEPSQYDALYRTASSLRSPQEVGTLRVGKTGGGAASLTQWRRPPAPIPYREDHVYTVVGTADQAIAGKLQVYSSVGYDGTCASSSYTCSGEFTIKIYGPPQEQGKVQTVSFVFTQGGRPKAAPRDLIDVRTAGRGSITFVNPDPDEPERVLFTEIKKGTAQVVREMDFALHPDLKLTFRLRQPVKSIDLYQAEDKGDPLGLGLDLEVVSSSDRDCPATKGGKPRPAELRLRDGAGKETDVISLVVAGCAHHNATFTGTQGKGSRVNVAIVHKR